MVKRGGVVMGVSVSHRGTPSHPPTTPPSPSFRLSPHSSEMVWNVFLFSSFILNVKKHAADLVEPVCWVFGQMLGGRWGRRGEGARFWGLWYYLLTVDYHPEFIQTKSILVLVHIVHTMRLGIRSSKRHHGLLGSQYLKRHPWIRNTLWPHMKSLVLDFSSIPPKCPCPQ